MVSPAQTLPLSSFPRVNTPTKVDLPESTSPQTQILMSRRNDDDDDEDEVDEEEEVDGADDTDHDEVYDDADADADEGLCLDRRACSTSTSATRPRLPRLHQNWLKI